jgi:prepilin-type processing-associated H-X9-DG protein
VVAIIALLISILLPSLSRAREITKRAVCASNARGIGQGYKVYANENADWYPMMPHPRAAGVDQNTEVAWIGHMADGLTLPVNTSGGGSGVSSANVHPSRALFMLVMDGTCSAAQFICPSSSDSEDDLRNQESAGTWKAAQLGRDRFDFRGYPYISYGSQLPYGDRAKPSESLDGRMILLADKGPYFTSGVSTSGWTTPDYARDTPGSGQPIEIEGATTATQILQVDTNRWKPYNSGIHGQEGQNCLYQDGHVEFEKRPTVGVNFDNIYTTQEGYTLELTLYGNTPKDEWGPLTHTDSVIVP